MRVVTHFHLFHCFTLEGHLSVSKVSLLSVSGELCPGRGPSPLPPEAAHVFRHRPYPLPPFTPLRSSGAFLNILPMSALSLINVKLQLEDKASILCAAPQTLIHLIVLIHMGKETAQSPTWKGWDWERKKRRHFCIFLSLVPSPQRSLYPSLCSFSDSVWEETIVFKNTLGQSTIAICVHHMCKKNFNNEKHYINIYF